MNNNHLDSFLDFYNEQKKPGYAVLITGDWGAGKTTHIRNKLTESGMYYISLFGLTSTEEIYNAVFMKMFPLKGKSKKISKNVANATTGTESFLFGIPGMLNGLMEAVIRDEVKNDKTIVFDDLERTNIKINEILGVINKYVEHHECRVIVIAHDEKIETSFQETKEKVFGQTLKFTPAVREVFQHFVNESQAPSAVSDNIKDHILETFEASGCNSLRVLKHTLNDCLRLLACLEAKHLTNDLAMEELFTLFTALTIGSRSGELKISDIKDRLENLMVYSMSQKSKECITPLITIKNKYELSNFSINFESNILSDEILTDIILNGYFHKNTIRKNINESYFFISPQDLKPWQKLINLEELDDHQVNLAISEIDTQILNKELIDLGDILHVFNIKFFMSYTNETSLSYDQILIDAKNYINSLVNLKTLPIANNKLPYPATTSSHAHGHGYWVLEKYKAQSMELAEYLEEQTLIALKNEYPHYEREILDSLKNDISSFSLMISRNHIENGKYAYLDVLSSIDIIGFVDIWLNLPRIYWDKVRLALKARYDTGLLRNELKSEKPWIEGVIKELHKRAAKENGLKKYRIEQLEPPIPTYE